MDACAATTGAVLAGRSGYVAMPDVSGIYGSAWEGPVFVLAHHPEDAPQAPRAEVSVQYRPLAPA